MDVYVPGEATRGRRPNYTLIFMHGGGYYISDKTKEERYIQPYLQRGVTVVNLNYRLKRGLPVATEDLTLALNFLQCALRKRVAADTLLGHRLLTHLEALAPDVEGAEHEDYHDKHDTEKRAVRGLLGGLCRGWLCYRRTGVLILFHTK